MRDRQYDPSRRQFIKTVGVTTLGAAAFGVPQFIPRQAAANQTRRPPNAPISLGLIGMGNRGMELLRALLALVQRENIRIAAVCDADDNRLEEASKNAGPQTAFYRDYRYILQRKDIDAVVLATPDPWHGVQFVQAAEYGKHIYCEIPACNTIADGQAILAAVKRTKIVAQIGAQGFVCPKRLSCKAI